MKKRQKRVIISGTAVGLACVLAAGALFQSSVSVAASSAMMPGIETIVNNTTQEEPLKILELVDDVTEAGIGYYISGQEPYLKLFSYETTDENGNFVTRTFPSVEEGLSVLPSYEERKAFVEGGSIRDLCGEDIQEYPLAFSEYQESYFLSEKEIQENSWKMVEFENDEVRTVDAAGHYEQVNPGEGNYTKEEVVYYPVRENVSSDAEKAKYRENIQALAYTGDGQAKSPYQVNFSPVTDAEGNYLTSFEANQLKEDYDYQNGCYGYYENIYRELTISTDFTAFPGEKDSFDTDTETVSPVIYRAERIEQYPNYKYTVYKTLGEMKDAAVTYPEDGSIRNITDGMVTVEADGTYKLWSVDENGAMDWEYLYYVEGRQQAAMESVMNLPEDYYTAGDGVPEVMPYYYKVANLAFSCVFNGAVSTDQAQEHPEAFAYTGWYYALTPENEEVYVETEDQAVYYTSEAEYTLKEGQGDYAFVSDSTEPEVKVQVNHLYFKGGYTNHDWMKRFVFHLSPEDEDTQVQQQFEEFKIQVDTLTIGEFESSYGNIAADSYDLVYINGYLSQTAAEAVAAWNVPCIINGEKAAQDAGAGIRSAFAEYAKEEDEDSHYVNKRVYFFRNTEGDNQIPGGGILTAGFHENLEDTKGFEEIEEYIQSENQFREIDQTENTELLTEEITTARVIEYILNYQYRRTLTVDGPVRVLELQPAKSSGQIDKVDVYRWLTGAEAVKLVNPVACCTAEGDISNILDKNPNTYWHNNYNNEQHEPQLFEAKILGDATLISGVTYTPRQTGNNNGTVIQYRVSVLNEKKEVLGTYEGDFGTGTYRNEQKINFEEQLTEDAAYIRFEFLKSYGSKLASCGEFGLITEIPEVEIDTMTTSEFAGHIEDINTKYDVIYIGDDETNLNLFANFRPNVQVLYYHVGGMKLAKYELQGLMNHDYTIDANGRKSPAAVGSTDVDGNMIGAVRGSGNDITEQLKNKLVDFVKSGYPVVTAGEIYTANKGAVSGNLVDSSSYLYDFLNEVKGWDNVVREQDITKESAIAFYAHLPKPQIVFAEEGGTPPSAIGTQDGPSGSYLDASDSAMTFHFQIDDQAEVSPATATYNCELYLDLNCDGNFSKAECMEDIEVREGSTVLNRNGQNVYELSLGKEYTVERTIPQEYIKLIPWKLVVENNENKEIRTSETGYTKRKSADTSNVIKVLQITPNSACTWNLSTDADFRNLLKNVNEDFQVEITSVTIQNYEANLKAQGQEYLNHYHMLIVGFGDGGAYGSKYETSGAGNFSLKGAESILAFAETGKSVIFAHDNTSSSNYDRTAADGGTSEDRTWKGWAYYFNQKLRAVSGMDRYGITDHAETEGTESSVSDILKTAGRLQSGSQEWDLLEKSPYDMAYALGEGKTRTYGETQGFTNGKLEIAVRGGKTGTPTTTTVSQVNQGAITEYPYKMDASFTVANTHMQYYQLAMEEDSDQDGSNDIVVWYCLGGDGDNFYGNSPNDVRNNYYIYSYKNIIYTGVGHSGVNNITEKKLFVNTIIAAYNAQAVDPDISFVEDSDWDAREQQDTYYTLDSVLSKDDSNLISNNLQFHLKIKDTNLAGDMVNAENIRKLKLELYVEDPDGNTVEGVGGTDVTVRKLQVPVFLAGSNSPVAADEKGDIYVNSGNLYSFAMENAVEFLKDKQGNFKSDISLYAKISCEYSYYGELRTAYDTARINIRQRQFFDMD